MERSECLLFAYLNDFRLHHTDFTRNSQMQVNLFCANNFLQKSYFSKKNFLLNHTSWVYFLDYMSLPYHFGKLWMSTFHWFQWFFTKAKRIHTILTNTSKLFFGPDLISNSKHKCNRCGKSFLRPNVLFAHVEKDHEGFECYICKKNFSLNNNLTRHIETLHKDIGKKHMP